MNKKTLSGLIHKYFGRGGWRSCGDSPADFPYAFFAEGGYGLAASGVEDGINGLVARLGEDGEVNYL